MLARKNLYYVRILKRSQICNKWVNFGWNNTFTTWESKSALTVVVSGSMLAGRKSLLRILKNSQICNKWVNFGWNLLTQAIIVTTLGENESKPLEK